VSEYWPAEHLAGTQIQISQYRFSTQTEIMNGNTVMDVALVIFKSHAVISLNVATLGLHHP
jgi:hypothetical protein